MTTGTSSYIVGIIDSFVNQFGVLFLIPIQAIIFGWIYGLDKLIPVLNDHSTIKVGMIWMLFIKYIAPVVLFGIWLVGIYELFSNATSFELLIDLSITIAVLILSLYFSRKKSANS